ncbi:MAG: response regulator transcription factor [Chloroflexota bacterium]
MNAQKPIRVLISDDHSVVRNGLKSFLTIFEDFELVGEARNGEQAVALAGMHQPDVILMDLMMPVLDGASATRKIKQKYPRIQIIALTSFKEQELVQSAIEAGAIGYLLKDLTAEELARAIRLAAEGKPTLSPEAAEVLIRASRPAQPTLGDDLTEREREVLNLIVEGLNNKQIAERLVVSVSTAKSHVSSILSKLGVSTRTEAVSLVLKKRI